MSMNNGPASAACLRDGAVPTEPAEAENPVWGIAVRVQSASEVTRKAWCFAVKALSVPEPSGCTFQ